MQIKEFIERAIEGGWKPKWTELEDEVSSVEVFANGYSLWLAGRGGVLTTYSFGDTFLDPEAWKAVGKVEGWENVNEGKDNGWFYEMHNMIDALAEGRSIESFLETL